MIYAWRKQMAVVKEMGAAKEMDVAKEMGGWLRR
jgi:hypothetical protein